VPANPDSILDSVKKTLGFDPEFTAFDLDIVLHINSAFGSLQQAGVGSDTGFVIQDNTTLWSQYVSSLLFLGMIKQYIFLAVKLAFDPPGTSFAIEAIQNQLLQLIWRINIAAETEDPPSDPFASTTITVDGTDVVAFIVKPITITFQAVVSMDAKRYNTFYLTMTGDCTINAPVNGADGEHITLELTSNGHVVTWGNGWDFGTAGEPELSSGGLTDIISAVYNEESATWRAGFTPGFGG
jgi:hypothetical protein